MGLQCEQCSLQDSTCDCAWEEIPADNPDGYVIKWDTENYPIDDDGICGAIDAEFPGDLCESYNPSNTGDYCERCGEYLGYEEDDECEESECICND
jgi:hypothetical protein